MDLPVMTAAKPRVKQCPPMANPLLKHALSEPGLRCRLGYLLRYRLRRLPRLWHLVRYRLRRLVRYRLRYRL